MRACELMKETFLRRTYIWIVHVVWLALYGGFWWFFLPDMPELGRFLFIWGGLFLALALSAGIFGDDIASGRICILVTKPFWTGELYIYRLLGLSLQAAVHLLLAGGLVLAPHAITGKGTVDGLGVWLLATWLLFNTCAASTASSTPRAELRMRGSGRSKTPSVSSPPSEVPAWNWRDRARRRPVTASPRRL